MPVISKRIEAVDVELAGDGKEALAGKGDGKCARYEGRVRDEARSLMKEVFKDVPQSEELHYRIPDALLTSLCEERGIERDEAVRLVLDGEV